jgi:hypothetical protein
MSVTGKELKKRFTDLCIEKDLLDEYVDVRARALTPEEAIGHPEDNDFPLQKGKERLMQAEFRGELGQAFVDQFGDYNGTLGEILTMPLENNYRRGVFIAAMNAALRYLGLVKKTIHCRDQQPGECAVELADHIEKKFGTVRVTQVGFQPRMVQEIAKRFPMRLLDMDPDNIGTEKFGVLVERPENTEEAVKWADMLLVTGTTVVNDTIDDFADKKPVIFYGTTFAGAAYLMGWQRFCARAT